MSVRLFLRPLRWLLYVAAALVLVYLVGANLVLNTPILDGVINKKREKTLVEWESGWTLLPGRIHVEGLRVRGQSKTQQWQFRLGEADVRLQVLALIDKTVRSTSVVGTDFHFRQRPRLTAEEAASADTGYYPEIEGLSNPPDPAPEDIYPPKKKTKRGWHIDVSNVRLTGSVELAVGDFKMSGRGTVLGGVDYQLRETMHVPRAVFDLEQGEIVIRGTTYAEDLHITTDVSVGPFVPKETKGLAIFDALLGQFVLENGTIPDVRVLNAMMPGPRGFELAAGTASFRWAFDKPTQEGSSGDIEIAARGTQMTMAGRAVSGDFLLNSRLERGRISTGRWAVTETTLKLENMDLSLVTAETDEAAKAKDAAATEPWWGNFTVRRGLLDLGTPGEVEIDFEFEIKDSEPLLQMFLAKPSKSGGVKLPGWAKLLPDIRNLEGRGRLQVKDDVAVLEKVVAEGENFDLTAWLESRNKVANGRLYLRYKSLDLGLELVDGRKDVKILRPKRWALEQPQLDHSAVPQKDG